MGRSGQDFSCNSRAASASFWLQYRHSTGRKRHCLAWSGNRASPHQSQTPTSTSSGAFLARPFRCCDAVAPGPAPRPSTWRLPGAPRALDAPEVLGALGWPHCRGAAPPRGVVGASTDIKEAIESESPRAFDCSGRGKEGAPPTRPQPCGSFRTEPTEDHVLADENTECPSAPEGHGGVSISSINFDGGAREPSSLRHFARPCARFAGARF
mmetsp:Transcript_3717/g.13734  ORF Transcript_3717/g.13734 Transcript_3717/m.13734 type:complete len:211 (-) Transcript_3717:7-639(-)